jgi:hypothetical protein
MPLTCGDVRFSRSEAVPSKLSVGAGAACRRGHAAQLSDRACQQRVEGEHRGNDIPFTNGMSQVG